MAYQTLPPGNVDISEPSGPIGGGGGGGGGGGNTNSVNIDMTNSELTGGLTTPTPNIFQQSSHPVALFFLLLFKFLALVQYLFAGWLHSDYILTCVLEMIWISLDFWTVKNISGRLLVGLRWWHQVRDGQTVWAFESAPVFIYALKRENKRDSQLFWALLYVVPGIWALFAFLALIQFHLGWMLITVFALAMSGTNLLGYYYCEQDRQKKLGGGGGESGGGITGILTNFLIRQRLKTMFGGGGGGVGAERSGIV